MPNKIAFRLAAAMRHFFVRISTYAVQTVLCRFYHDSWNRSIPKRKSIIRHGEGVRKYGQLWQWNKSERAVPAVACFKTRKFVRLLSLLSVFRVLSLLSLLLLLSPLWLLCLYSSTRITPWRRHINKLPPEGGRLVFPSYYLRQYLIFCPYGREDA